MNIKTVSLSAVVVVLFLFCIKFFDISYPLKVTVANTSQELVVVGEGKVEAIPDIAYIDIGITTSNIPTTEEAKAKIDGINNKIVGALKQLGISSKDIKTTNYSINPSYIYENNTSRISGYDGNATITVKTKKIETVSQIIEEATNAGANQINNTRFIIENPAKYREAAREMAIKNAKDQAEKMTKSLGIKLGKVVNVMESLNSGTSPMLYSAKAFQGGGGMADVSLEAGSETVTSTVTLYFEKK